MSGRTAASVGKKKGGVARRVRRKVTHCRRRLIAAQARRSAKGPDLTRGMITGIAQM
jgi:hypothetical protein